MITRRTILIGSLSGLVGIIIGMAVAHQFLVELNANITVAGWSLTTQADIATRVALLEDIRAGQCTKATSRLESLVDANLIGAAEIAGRGEKLSTDALHAIEKERTARAESGYQPADPNVKALVDKAWHTLATQTGHPEKQ